ncbi:GIY-YIG nuclease family protein [Pectobacterium aquaticum]|uniref:GIY-YIG nuclease family protein n=1 Tax=Pectobacterium aquaticum TaxID=2204145 RepID=UPI00142DDCF1|nr:GIY-YIG nuclease family protein [Pectobacterium aquaticum]UEM40618.1 GIY-YIG nuclease family protein [Pectobacterium aquaticum]
MKKQIKTYTMYTLELEDNCYYVGVTKFLSRSLSKHYQGKCSWTRQHKPLRVKESYYINIRSEDELPSLVKNKANEYARLYGVGNVGFWQKVFRNYFIYVWELDGGNYYIGITSNLENRTLDHIGKRGSDWTKKYKPIRLVEKTIFSSDDINYVYRIENIKTIEYMNRYGIEKVRGGRFNSTEILSKSIISKYLKKYHIPSSIYEEIMTYAKPELVPKNLWSLVCIHRNDPYKNILYFNELKKIIIERNIMINCWPYTSDYKNKLFACWILRGFNPEFACYFIDTIKVTKTEK